MVIIVRVKGHFAPGLQVMLGGIGRRSNVPRRTKDVEGFGEDVVVDDAGVDGEQTHQQQDVSTTKENIPDLRKERVSEADQRGRNETVAWKGRK